MIDTTVVVPTRNEGDNVACLIARLAAAFRTTANVEVLFVDDSTDNTPERIRDVIAAQVMPVRLLHRQPAERTGGLSGAVTAGIAAARGTYIVVMDGDLQHPPELAPQLRQMAGEADLAVASRYCGGGEASGLSDSWRRAVSSSSTLLARSCFPRRVGRVCTDPMTGFFCFRRSAVQLDRLQPRGFKILLEILARHDLRVIETPFIFGDRLTGDSKASWRNGMQFLRQLAALRMGAMSRFAAVGALGVMVNLLTMAVLLHTVLVANYLAAAVLAAELSILLTFFMQERFISREMGPETTSRWLRRFPQHVLFNNTEALVRLPLLVLLVESLGFPPIAAQVVTLASAFLIRFLFVTRAVYRPVPVTALPVTALPVAPAAVASTLKEPA